MFTLTDGKYVWSPTRCENPACIVKSLDNGLFIGPNGEDYCRMHAKEAWQEYRRKVLGIADPSLNKDKPVPIVNLKRLSGVLVRYDVYPSKPIPSIWTPTRLYPYPNHRRRFGLKGSYALTEGKIVSWGKHQDPCDRKPVAQEVKP